MANPASTCMVNLGTATLSASMASKVETSKIGMFESNPPTTSRIAGTVVSGPTEVRTITLTRTHGMSR